MATQEPCVKCKRPTVRRSPGSGKPVCRDCAHPPKDTYEKIRPLPAGKSLAPYRPPPRPAASRFADIPGQGMLSLDDEEPERINYGPDPG